MKQTKNNNNNKDISLPILIRLLTDVVEHNLDRIKMLFIWNIILSIIIIITFARRF